MKRLKFSIWKLHKTIIIKWTIFLTNISVFESREFKECFGNDVCSMCSAAIAQTRIPIIITICMWAYLSYLSRCCLFISITLNWGWMPKHKIAIFLKLTLTSLIKFWSSVAFKDPNKTYLSPPSYKIAVSWLPVKTPQKHWLWVKKT